MAGALWVSDSGIRRKGTSFGEIQQLFVDRITTRHIYEPLHSANINDDPSEILSDLTALDFDIAGVIDSNRKLLGYIRKDQLQQGAGIDHALNKIDLGSVVSDSTPIYRLIKLLDGRDFVFVMQGNTIEGIVTVADVHKPIVRLYLFGIISLFEMHLNYWVETLYPSDGWTDALKPERVESALNVQSEKTNKNEALSLVVCLQFCDKREILSRCQIFLKDFSMSRETFNRMTSRIERVRNELAHSQATVMAGLDQATFVKIISQLEEFLEESERRALLKGAFKS
jgi:predicted transcriptional regulator